MRPHDLSEADGETRASAVLLHPHPDMGGDRFNNVVSELFRCLPGAGVTTLRFDFSSSDVAIAIAETAELLDALPTVPKFVVGYSFGGGVAAAMTDARIAGWFLVAPALSLVEPLIGADPRPKAVVAADQDQFFPPAQLEATTSGWERCAFSSVSGADHFFAGRTDVVADRCIAWIDEVTRA